MVASSQVSPDDFIFSHFTWLRVFFSPARPGCVLRKAHGDDGAGM